ncbi:MAG: hypothetical protein AB7Q17_14565, partial [Phycisphaerae bacterium]
MRSIAVVALAALVAGDAARAADWRVLGTRPASLAATLVTLADTDEGEISLGANEVAFLTAGGADAAEILLYILGPARVAFVESGEGVLVHAGRVSFFAQAPAAEQSVALLLPGDADQPALRAVIPRGRLIVERAADGATSLGYESGDAWPADAEKPYPASTWLNWSPAGIAPAEASFAERAGAYALGRVATEVGIESARRQRLSLQPQLVINLARVEPTLQEEFVTKLAAPTRELRIVTPSAAPTLSQPLPPRNAAAGLSSASEFLGSVRFPGTLSPAQL